MTRPLTEAQWQARVVDYARWARWRVYHVGDSRTVIDLVTTTDLRRAVDRVAGQ